MSKSKSFLKYLNNINTSINNLLEKNLNKLNFNNLRNLTKNNKLILTFVALFVLFISYLLLPTFFKTTEISKVLKFELKNKLNLDFNLSNNLSYNFFPLPHFKISDSSISDKNIEISQIKNLKIYISPKHLFSLKDIYINDVIIENANFNFNNTNYNFFIRVLNNKFSKINFEIKKSNVFFRNIENEVLFINKIKNLKYYYDKNEQKNILYSENELFNILYVMELFNNQKEKKLFSELNFNFLKMQIENELDYNDELKIGKSNVIFNKSKSTVSYKLNKNFLKFNFYDKLENPQFSYKGNFNLNPFYSSLVGKIEELNLSYLINNNSFFVQLLKTEMLNNKNIDFLLELNAQNIYRNPSFLNVNIYSKIKDGLIDFDNTNFSWKNFVDFQLLDTLIFLREGEIVMDGKLIININNYNEIYKFLLTPKNYRKKLKEIEFNFSYNFDQKTINLTDVKIDNSYNQNISRIMSNMVFKKNNLKNKIYLKKILNDAIKSYAG